MAIHKTQTSGVVVRIVLITHVVQQVLVLVTLYNLAVHLLKVRETRLIAHQVAVTKSRDLIDEPLAVVIGLIRVLVVFKTHVVGNQMVVAKALQLGIHDVSVLGVRRVLVTVIPHNLVARAHLGPFIGIGNEDYTRIKVRERLAAIVLVIRSHPLRTVSQLLVGVIFVRSVLS